MASLNESFSQLLALWERASIAQRLTVVGGAVGGTAVFLSVAIWGSQPDYATLMTGVSPSDAAEISAELGRWGTDHRIQAGGVVSVPKAEVHSLRLKLAAQGLPRGGGVGFEIFDNPKVGTSRFTEKVNYRRALEGELSRTIRGLDSVSEARVHIVLPERSLFRSKEREASASVTLELEPGRRLSAEQVHAVRHLTSSAVVDLDPSQVTIVDSRGAVLARAGGAMAASDDAMDHQRSVERRLEGRVTEILERVVGPGNASVRVSAEIDFTHSESTQEKFDPDNFAVRSEQTTEEQEGRNAATATGIPGTRSNLTGAENAGPSSGESSRVVAVKNYEINKVTHREVTRVGRTKRLSVAVLLNENTKPNADGQVEPRSERELEAMADLVKRAVGFDPARGDKVEVKSLPFVPPEEIVEDVRPEWLTYVEDFWKPAVGVVVVSLLAFGVIRRTRGVTENLLAQPMTVREMEAGMTGAPHALPAEGATAAAPAAMNVDPEQTADVVRMWLTERPAQNG